MLLLSNAPSTAQPSNTLPDQLQGPLTSVFVSPTVTLTLNDLPAFLIVLRFLMRSTRLQTELVTALMGISSMNPRNNARKK
jgi:hypothetical protein